MKQKYRPGHLATDAPTIRDVLLFPHMRPESGN